MITYKRIDDDNIKKITTDEVVYNIPSLEKEKVRLEKCMGEIVYEKKTKKESKELGMAIEKINAERDSEKGLFEHELFEVEDILDKLKKIK